MIDDHDVREMLQRRAHKIPATPVGTPTTIRRARRRLVLNGVVATLAAVAIAVTTFAGVDAIRTAPLPADDRTGELGIFAPVAGRIVYLNDGIDRGYDPGLWAVDPDSPEDPLEGRIVADEIASDLVQLSPVDARPLGWSRDGTELLIMRTSPQPNGPVLGLLSILHADGSETPVTTDPMFILGATISPDGLRVVFAGETEGGMGLYAVGAHAGPAEVLLEGEDSMVYEPTFSPDGTQIAYVRGGGDHDHHVWVMDADGTDAHEIVSNEWTAPVGHVQGLAWSPAGDRIALGLVDGPSPAIYMFAPDGSDFTQVIPGGARPYWSPDGSRIAYTIPAGLAIADADGSNVRAFGFAASGPWHPAGSAQPNETTPPPSDSDPTPTPALSVDLGTFEPVAGRIVYGDGDGIWGVDPAAPADPATRVQVTSEAGIPLGWSSDGTRLLIMRQIHGERVGWHLFVMHSNGSETQVTERPMVIQGATISPDASRVVFAGWTGDGSALYSVDAVGGRPVVLLEAQRRWVAGFDGPAETLLEEPTFSPDGTQIAYVDGAGDHSHSVWLMDADGSNAHQILADETTGGEGGGAGHAYGLAWSPAGDRIALGLEGATYTFATDGSGFTQVITRGDRPYWSPDGSQIAYTISCLQDPDGCGLAIADADGSNAQDLGFATSGPWHPAPPGSA
jgi:Tol biopolymer transport system component